LDTDGFTLGGTSDGNGNTGADKAYASWNWLKGANTTAVSNTDGSITSSVSASTTSGFSIVSLILVQELIMQQLVMDLTSCYLILIIVKR
jgi:uncharacterized membrane protein